MVGEKDVSADNNLNKTKTRRLSSCLSTTEKTETCKGNQQRWTPLFYYYVLLLISWWRRKTWVFLLTSRRDSCLPLFIRFFSPNEPEKPCRDFPLLSVVPVQKRLRRNVPSHSFSVPSCHTATDEEEEDGAKKSKVTTSYQFTTVFLWIRSSFTQCIHIHTKCYLLSVWVLVRITNSWYETKKMMMTMMNELHSTTEKNVHFVSYAAYEFVFFLPEPQFIRVREYIPTCVGTCMHSWQMEKDLLLPSCCHLHLHHITSQNNSYPPSHAKKIKILVERVRIHDDDSMSWPGPDALSLCIWFHLNLVFLNTQEIWIGGR